MKDKLSRLSKFAQHQEIKALLKKQDKNETESLDFSDDISNDGNDDDRISYSLLAKPKQKLHHLPTMKVIKNGQNHFQVLAFLRKNPKKKKKKIQKRKSKFMKIVATVISKELICYSR